MRPLSKGLLALVLAIAIAAGVAACGDDDDDGEETTAAGGTESVELLLSFPESIAWAPLLVGREQGYFEDEGLEITTQETEGSGFVTQQIIAGNADYGWAAGDAIIVAASKDPDLRVAACNQERNIFRVVTLADSGVTSVDDLAGQTLGFTEKGGGEEPMVNSIVSSVGDVQTLPVGAAGPQSQKALEDGQIAAYASSYPDVDTLTAEGLDLADITPEEFEPVPGDCLVVSQSTLEDETKRDIVERIGRAWAMGAVFTTENPTAALDIACPQVPEECQDMAFAKQYMNSTADLLVPTDPETTPIAGVDIAGFEASQSALLDAGTIDSEVDLETLINSEDVAAVQEAIQDFDAGQVESEAREAN
jgi:NitT/TauT family transport system substrate-binding protein